MFLKILDVNNLVTYVDTKNIVALNSFYSQDYEEMDILHQVILNGNCNIEVTEQTFNKLKELLYDKITEIK